MRASGLLRSRSSVDHICLSKPLAKRVVAVGAWEGTTDDDGCRMSDHNGVVIDIDAQLWCQPGPAAKSAADRLP